MQKSPSFFPSSHRAPSAPPPASGWRAPLLPASPHRSSTLPLPHRALLLLPLLSTLRGAAAGPRSLLSHDDGGRIRLCSAARYHLPAPHTAGSVRVAGARGGSGGWHADMRVWRLARAACAGAAAGRDPPSPPRLPPLRRRIRATRAARDLPGPLASSSIGW